MIRYLAVLLAGLLAACATDTRMAPDTASERVLLAPVTTMVALDESDPAALADLIRGNAGRGIAASYRVVAPPGLADRAQVMLDRATAERLAPATLGVAADARLHVEVTLLQARAPKCPDWSRRSDDDFSNRPSSNFGCADAVNLANQVANPGDLIAGHGRGSTAAGPVAAAVKRLATGRTSPLTATDTQASDGPISADPRP